MKFINKHFKIINVLTWALAFIAVFAIRVNFIGEAFVPSESMYPTLAKNEFMLYQKTTSVNYDDIIVFHPVENNPIVFVKRVIGMQGDKIAVKNGKLYRNGEAVTAPYTLENTIDYEMDEVVVPANSVFVMGDNRNNSEDSHILGSIPVTRIIGKIYFHGNLFADKELEAIKKELQE